MKHKFKIVMWALACSSGWIVPAGAAATLVGNVHGYTLAGDKLQQFSGLVFDAGKVIATGEDAALRKQYAGAKYIDGGGATLLPGLIDAHGHVFGLGYKSAQIDLDGTASLAEAQERVRTFLKSHPGTGWVQGDGWNQVRWKLGRFPLASELDAVVADRPAALGRIDGHAMWLNSLALKQAGITKATRDPVGGRIERDAQGNPSGVLVDMAMDLANKVIPPPDEEERRAALRAALAQLNAVGLTSVDDAGASPEEIAEYKSFADQGQLSVRIYAMIRDVADSFTPWAKSGPLLGYKNDFLTVRSVKLFADGALGSRGAALMAPYSDAPGQRGLLFHTDAELTKKVETALKAGFQVNIHAIGDAANHQVLDAFETAYRTVGGSDLRNRVEHAQVVSLSDIPRFKTLNLIASMQPTHATSDMNMAEDRIGKERLKGAYAWRTFLDQGTRIAGGSDFPVEYANPFFGLHAAVTRTDHENHPPGGWQPSQAMTLLEAFRAFTLDAAYAQHQEKSLGSLEPGKWADFILIDQDLFKMPQADIWKIKVKQTWVAGRKVY